MIRSDRRIAACVGLVVLLVALLRMLFPSAIGLSDQGDAHRLLCQLGLEVDMSWHDRITPDVSSTAYVPMEWERHDWYGDSCGANGTGQPYRSSEVTLLRGAQILTPVLGFDAALDLRALAVVCSALLAVLVALLYLALSGGTAVRLFTVGFVTLTLLDRRVAGVFASGYSEPAALLGSLAVVVASLFVLRRRTPSLPALVALTGAGAFTLTSKSQMVAVLPLVVTALVWRRSASVVTRPGASWWVRIIRAARARTAGIVCSLVLVAITSWYLSSQPPRFEEVNRHNQLFHTLLALDDQPEDDLRWFGLDPSLAPLAGTNITANDALVSSPAYAEVADISQADLVRFYATHPGRLALLARRGLDAAASADLSGYLASYPRSSGEPPHTFENRIWLVSALFEIADAVPVLLVVVVLGSLVVSVLVVRRSDDPEVEGPALVATGVALAAMAAGAAAVWGDGTVELPRHLMIADVFVAWCVPFTVAARFGARHERPELALPPDIVDRLGTSVEAPDVDGEVEPRPDLPDGTDPSFDELFDRFVASDPDGSSATTPWRTLRWRRSRLVVDEQPEPSVDERPERPEPVLDAAALDPWPEPLLGGRRHSRAGSGPIVEGDSPPAPQEPPVAPTPSEDVEPEPEPEPDPDPESTFEEPEVELVGSETESEPEADWLDLSADDFLAALRARHSAPPTRSETGGHRP